MADDYMSDDIIKHAEKIDKSKPKPKLPPKPEPVKSLVQLQEQSREEGLSKEIGQENIGFKLLAKMGFKQGMKLGKNEDGISEPIPLNLKRGREGIGIEETKRKKKEEVKVEQQQNVVSFKERMSEKFVDKRMSNDLRKALSICKKLDFDKEIKESEFYKQVSEYSEEEKQEEASQGECVFEKEEFTSMELPDKLSLVLDYLRKKHLYCLYCGVTYKDEADLENCPGISYEDHDEL